MNITKKKKKIFDCPEPGDLIKHVKPESAALWHEGFDTDEHVGEFISIDSGMVGIVIKKEEHYVHSKIVVAFGMSIGVIVKAYNLHSWLNPDMWEILRNDR